MTKIIRENMEIFQMWKKDQHFDHSNVKKSKHSSIALTDSAEQALLCCLATAGQERFGTIRTLNFLMQI